MNEARENAGFSSFKLLTEKFPPQTQIFWQHLCHLTIMVSRHSLRPSSSVGDSGVRDGECFVLFSQGPGRVDSPDGDDGVDLSGEPAEPPKGVYAFARLTSSNPNCEAIVQQWQGAHINFVGPPPKHGEDDGLYLSADNVSLIALYNSGADASAACTIVTCTKSDKSRGRFASASKQSETAHSLLCRTTPDILDTDDAPYT